MLCGYRESWITYRTATEHLRQAYFRYRTGLHPFGGPDAPRELERELARVNKFVHETNESPPGPLVTLWRLWHMKSPVERTAGGVERSAPGVSHPRASGTVLDHGDNEAFLSSYTSDQQLWHYRKAKTYLWRFLAVQTLILLASGLGMWLSWRFGPEIWIMGVLGAANILMIYVGDFFDLSALFQRYYYVVSELRRLGHEYRLAEGPFAVLSDRTGGAPGCRSGPCAGPRVRLLARPRRQIAQGAASDRRGPCLAEPCLAEQFLSCAVQLAE